MKGKYSEHTSIVILRLIIFTGLDLVKRQSVAIRQLIPLNVRPYDADYGQTEPTQPTKRENITMTHLKYITLIIAVLLAFNSELSAQQSVNPQQLSSATVIQLLQMDCGTNDQLRGFTDAIKGLGSDQASLLRDALRQGLNEKQKAQIATQAIDRYRARQRWLKQQGSEVLDKQTIQRMTLQSEQKAIQSAIYRAELKQRENAIRALGLVGNRKDLKLIKGAVSKEPKLKQIAKQAINMIKERM